MRELQFKRSKWTVLVLVVGSVAALSQTSARHHSHQREILAAAGPVTIKTEPMTVVLKSLSGAILPRLQSLRRDQQIVLRLQGIELKQPAEVLYQVILNLREGAVPSPGAPGFVGTLDLFQAEQDAKPGNARRSRTYLLIGILERLQARHQSNEPFSVTIAPLGKPADKAEATVERLELVLETGKPD